MLSEGVASRPVNMYHHLQCCFCIITACSTRYARATMLLPLISVIQLPMVLLVLMSE